MSGFLILCEARRGVAATKLRNGDGEIPKSEANAETCLRRAGAENAEERREETRNSSRGIKNRGIRSEGL
jgi:hypothetical protein